MIKRGTPCYNMNFWNVEEGNPFESGTVWFAALQGFSQQGQCYWPLPCLNACDQWKQTVRNETKRFSNVKDLGHPQTSRISAFKQLSRTHLWQLRMSSHPKGNKPISALGHNCQKQKSLLLIPISMNPNLNHHMFIFKPVRSDVNAKPGRVSTVPLKIWWDLRFGIGSWLRQAHWCQHMPTLCIYIYIYKVYIDTISSAVLHCEDAWNAKNIRRLSSRDSGATINK